MDTAALEESLKATRDSLNHWSDIATAGVVLGLFLEYGIEFAESVRKWRWKPLHPGPLWGHKVLPKVGAALVVLGIAGELSMHMRLSQTDDQLLVIQQDKDRAQETTIGQLNEGIAGANARTAEAKRETAEIFRLIAPRQVRWTDDAKAFARFPGTKVVVRYEMDDDRCEDCRSFATSFAVLNTSEINWKVVSWIGVDRRVWNPSMGFGPIASGVTVLSRRPSWWNDPGQGMWSAPPPEPPGGYSVRDRTWAAGYALIQYLRQTTVVEGDHAFLDLGGSIDASEFGNNLDLGEDTMVIEIGKRSIERDTLQRMLDERTGHALSGEK